MSGIQMVWWVMWLYHLNTGHPYCSLFRCSVFRWILYCTVLNVGKLHHISPPRVFKGQGLIMLAFTKNGTHFPLFDTGTQIPSFRSGGPQPWIKEPRSHFHKVAVEGEDESVVTLTQRLQAHPASADKYSFQVSCQKYGTVDLLLTVGNQKSATLPRPGKMECYATHFWRLGKIFLCSILLFPPLKVFALFVCLSCSFYCPLASTSKARDGIKGN